MNKRPLGWFFSMFMATEFCLSAFSGLTVGAEPPRLTIGSPAPSLHVSEWVAGRDPTLSKEVAFEKGKVVVVEFWATWCPPCVASIPHLAKLQSQYKEAELQIIGVTDEDADTANQFLDENRKGKTRRKIASGYWLAADPDRSTSNGYLTAANIDSIPTAFLVGKTGLIEWIGNPRELDGPLEQVMQDKWDRNAFLEEYTASLRVEGLFEEALRQSISQLGQASPSSTEYYREHAITLRGKPRELCEFGRWLAKSIASERGFAELAAETIVAIEAEVETVDSELVAYLWNTVALLHESTGDVEAAVKAQRNCVAAASPLAKPRHQLYLEKLVKKLARFAGCETGLQRSMATPISSVSPCPLFARASGLGSRLRNHPGVL